MNFIIRLLGDELGATAIEYGFVMVLVTFGIISATQGMGVHLGATFEEASSGFGSP